MSLKRLAIILILPVLTLMLRAATYTLYVSNQTTWSTFDLYAWGDSEAFGTWPGATYAATTTLGGTTYCLYPYSVSDGAAVMEMHLIFHNNVGENQPADRRRLITLTEPRDYYLAVTDDAITLLPAPDPATEPEQPDATPFNVDNTTPLSPHNRVIYELNLYDFTTAGTLAAAQARLPELRTLGIDIIWLMPIYPRSVQGRIGSLGSPYAPADYTAVNPDHGSLQDLQHFVNAAHDLGMEVWLDWVPNHTGLDHVWVTTHPEYYVRRNGAIQHPNDYGDVYLLDYSSAALCNAMTDAMLYWVNQADIDGFRCDYVSSPQIPVSYWQQAIPALQQNSRGKRVCMLGEADFTDQTRLYPAGFDYDYAWGFADGIKSVGTGTDATSARNALQTLLNALAANYGTMSRMTYLTNHDDIGNNFSSNYMTRLGSNVAPLTVLYFTSPGMPLLYNGQEIGLSSILNYFNRNTIPWSNVNHALHNTIRTLIALKHTQPALADGPATERAATRLLTTGNSSVLAYERTRGDNTLLVLLSLSNQPVNVTLSGINPRQYACILNSQTIASGCYITTESFSATPTIQLEPKGYRIYTNSVGAPDTYHIYVSNQTTWSTFDLYEWGIPNELFGAWPGATAAEQTQSDNMTWRDYPYSVAGGTTEVELNLIFHNNVGENQPADRRRLITLTEPRDYYLIVTDDAITEYNPTTDITSVAVGDRDAIGDKDTAPDRDKAHTATKHLRHGRLLIIRPDGRTYTVLGTRL